ncbi:MAG: ribosome recycling factor [Patescibacteria group bacterium]
MNLIDNYSQDFIKAVEHFRQDIATLKTGRANPALLDAVTIEAYGAKTPLNQLASVSVPEARVIIVQPWDKNLIKDVEKGIIDANLGLAPVNEGERIRIFLPQMTEEMRKEIVKHLHQKAEQARVAIRTLRDQVKEAVLTAEKNKEFGEDEKYNLLEQLDKKVGDYNNKLKAISEEKEKEIMTI